MVKKPRVVSNRTIRMDTHILSLAPWISPLYAITTILVVGQKSSPFPF